MDHQDFNAEHSEHAPHLKLQLIQARDYYNNTHPVHMHTQNQLQTTGLSYEAMQLHAQIPEFLHQRACGHLIKSFKTHFSRFHWFNFFHFNFHFNLLL